jgi:hypothetical protein
MGRRQRALILCKKKKGVYLVAVANSAVLPEGKAGSNPAVTSMTPQKQDVLIGKRCPAEIGIVT